MADGDQGWSASGTTVRGDRTFVMVVEGAWTELHRMAICRVPSDCICGFICCRLVTKVPLKECV